MSIAWVPLLVLASTVHAQPVELGVSSRAGQLWLDQGLRDFRWDTTGQMRWGLELQARRGAWSAALSGDRSHTTQATGIPGSLEAPRVQWTAWGTQLRRHQELPAGFEVHAGVQVGRLQLSWDPSRLVVDAPGVSQPIQVDYRPLGTWYYGPQIGLQWSALRSLDLVARFEYSRFSLDTAHQSSGSIVEERRTFGAWQWSLGVALHPWSLP